MDNEKAVSHMKSVVENSCYAWITDFQFFGKPRNYVLFRQYGLVKWLEANYKARLDAREIQDFTRQVRDVQRPRAEDRLDPAHEGHDQVVRPARRDQPGVLGPVPHAEARPGRGYFTICLRKRLPISTQMGRIWKKKMLAGSRACRTQRHRGQAAAFSAKPRVGRAGTSGLCIWPR